jgi:hypothetical protein
MIATFSAAVIRGRRDFQGSPIDRAPAEDDADVLGGWAGIEWTSQVQVRDRKVSGSKPA